MSSAQSGTPGTTAAPPIVPDALPATPEGYRVSARDAIEAAEGDPEVAGAIEGHAGVQVTVQVKLPAAWQVGHFAGEREIAHATVDSQAGVVQESWTGYQVAWPMARGYESQFGHKLNAPYVWIALSAIFLFGLIDLRRLRRIVHLDLLVLLSFGISHIFFNEGEIGLSAPLAYPPLLYLLGRMLWVGFRGAGEGLRPTAPIGWLAVAGLFLLGFRLALNVADSGVIDVGYAGVVGADRIAHGEPIYGSFPSDNPYGDTYGPANYYAYVPFELALPWSGAWDDLPAAHAAAIFFDLATLAGLFLLGKRLARASGGPGSGAALGVILCFGWVAFPYTAFALQSNSNDSLVAALLVWAFVFFSSPVARGTFLALGSAAKFGPLALAPLLAAGERGVLARGRKGSGGLPSAAVFAASFVAAACVLLAHPAVEPGLTTFWERTVESQLERESPFSIWGQSPSLEWLQDALKLATVGLAILVAFVPRRRSVTQVAALSAAVLIALQLMVEHWFYLYIPWFFPLLLVVLLGTPTAQPLPSSNRR